MAADLEDKALRCEGIDCDHEQDRWLVNAGRFDATGLSLAAPSASSPSVTTRHALCAGL